MSTLTAPRLRPPAQASSRRQRPCRPAVPGPVWGVYPQARETDYPVRARRQPLRNPHRVARRALQLAGGAPINSSRVRWALARLGLNEASCALALACVAQHYARTRGLSPHPNQFTTAALLLNQQLVELATGEGKTLAAALAAAVLAMTGAPVHVLTANDYLASRDAADHQDFFAALGLNCAAATATMTPPQRRQAWQQAVCYATAKTCAFDYLRDQDSKEAADPPGTPSHLLRGLCVAIVDEADCLLIDEASIPLVLAEPVAKALVDVDPALALALAGQLTPRQDFDCHPERRSATIRPQAMKRLAALHPGFDQLWFHADYRTEVISHALVALYVLRRDVDYLVRDESIALIDAATGRVAEGRVLPGLLQALICAKESLPPPGESSARSGLSYPRFFARYHHLCGLSGTLHEVRGEIRKSYGLRVSRVAPHQPSQRRHFGHRLFSNQQQLCVAVLQRARTLAAHGRPVLIGTDNVAQARALALAFNSAGIEANLLDAANADTEAEQISQAGKAGRITISTQIAGRGTDIKPDSVALQAGGLHVLNLQSNRSARIDRQMTGRAARQGEPGSAEHWCVLNQHEQANYRADTSSRLLRMLHPVIRYRPLAAVIVHLRQQLWQWHDRSQRVKRLRADLNNSRELHFSTLSRQ